MTNEIPFFSLNRAPDSLRREWLLAINEVLESGQFIGGTHVMQFEENWAFNVGVAHAVGVGNGLDGIVVALRALGIGQGDLVAVPAHTFIATWNAIKLVGATPIGVDVDELGLIDLDQLESLEVKIGCVVPVHMHGAMVNMDRLRAWARDMNVFVVEDASQSHGANYGKWNAGQTSDIGVFSLYPTKNLGAIGDAGVVVTNDKELALKIRSITNYGASSSNKYRHEAFGINSRLDSIQAAILSVNLRYLNEWTLRRREISDIYIENLIENSEFHVMNKNPKSSVWHHFPVFSNDRDRLINHLKSHGISTEIHYPRTAAEEYSEITGDLKKAFPKAELIARKILSLPISPWHSDEEIRRVCDAVNIFSAGT